MRISFAFFWSILNLLLLIGLGIFLGYLFCLLIRALEKYLAVGQKQEEQFHVSLGQWLRELRMEHGYTQEYVAEMLGVSRQAVSKWENGSSEPSTAKLFALAQLYGLEVAELLENIQ